MEKGSFILYTEQKEVIDKLSDEQAGKLIKAIYEYEKTGIMPKLDNLLDIIITPFKLALDKNRVSVCCSSARDSRGRQTPSRSMTRVATPNNCRSAA